MVTCGFYHRLVEEQLSNMFCQCVGCLGKNCSNCDHGKKVEVDNLLTRLQILKCQKCLQSVEKQRC